MLDVKKRILAVGEHAGKNTRKVRCEGCKEWIESSDPMEEVDYVKTKRGTDIFFHKRCRDKVWNSRI